MNIPARLSAALTCAIAIGCIAESVADAAEPALSVTTSPKKYEQKVTNGLAFAEFKGYENWEVVGLSQSDKAVAVILGNPAMIEAYKAGIPDNGKPFPNGARFAKVHWAPVKNASAPGNPTVAGALHDVDFMVKDTQRFADSGGWGYAAFKYVAESNSFTPFTEADSPPQANDAKCGLACHTVAKDRDYVFTRYSKR